ncbi:MAG: gliding motility-associated C-terminal domain-containing protein, partial [Bacteroidia bacterium]|nr:gliding motility-associated C-terminal domain-containing protein [Bacteroidia bacterium]
TDGIKYSLIVHPGADISKVKMKYDDMVKLNDNGDLGIPTLFGDIVEHAPVTFYSENKSNIISSHFIKADKTISFKLGEYDHTKTVIIDPWVQTPTISNSNSVWECERDAAGNVYIIGGDMPMKLIKYDAAGALQWTYNTTWDTSIYWLGTFAVDLAGNSYVTSGTQSKISKVNTAGGNVWTNNSIGGGSQELWNITFNCDQTRLIIGGTSGIFTLRGSIFDLDVTNGSVVTNKIVGYDKALLMGAMGPDEVRSICSAQNGKYYFLILDSVGRISQNFTACSSNSSLYKISSTYDFAYYNPSYRYSNSGIMAIKANKNFLYTQNGTTLHKRSLGSLAILSSVTIPGGVNVAGVYGNPGQVPGSSGLDIDSCGNVYVGSSTGVYKYDANLTQIGSVSLPFTVFDITVSMAGNVIVAGSTTQTSGVRTGYVQSIASFAACKPLALFCCDASVCNVAAMCSSAAAVTLIAATPGGTWSGAGVNTSTGVFTPATAGAGVHTIIYTLPCGADSISITVNACATLTACQEINGNITVSGGTAPYTWQRDSTFTDCSGCFGGQCMPPICNGVPGTISTTFATGTTITPSGTYPFHVNDASSNSLIITSLASLPNCSNTCPPLTVTASAIINDSCFGASTGSFSASTSGGVSPWDYTLLNGGGTTVATFSNIAGTQNFTGLPAGTYTLNVLDNSSCPGTTTVTITEPSAATTTATAGADQSMCSNSATLAGNVPTVGTGIWTLVSGTGTITTPASETSGTTGLGVGANVFQWTISNAPCPSTSDQVTITNTGGGAPAAAGPDQSVCSNSAILAGNVPSFGTGLWTLVSGTATITTPSSATSGISGLGIGVSVFEWTISNPPCPSTSDQITITNTGGGPTVTINSQTNVSCYGGNDGSTVASATGGTGSLTYLWTPTGGGSASANNLMAGTYTISVTDGNGCVGIETVAITQSDSIAATVTTTPTGCGSSDGSATVVATGGTGNLTYLWSNGGTLSQISNLSSQIYSVTITDDLGCTKAGSGTVTSTGGPTASVGADVTINSGSSTLLSSSGGGTYFWTPPAGLDCDTCRTPIASPVVTTIYCVTVSDNGGCTDTACLTVTVADTVQVITCGTLYVPVGSVYVPSAFTPNNNDILNDVFKPVANCVHDYNFLIFNRWGEKLFETNDKDVGWSGIYKGSMSKADVYVYKITFWDDPKNEFHQFIGKVTLLR